MTSKIYPALVVLLLAACGGSGGETSNTTKVTPAPDVTIEQLGERLETAFNAANFDDNDDIEPTLFTDLPQGDVVTYTGATVIIAEDVTYALNGDFVDEDTTTAVFAAVGAARVTADTTRSSVTVNAGNFYEINDLNGFDISEEVPDFSLLSGARIDGTLSATLEQVDDSTTNGYMGVLSGSFRNTSIGDVAVDLDASGLFTGTGGEIFAMGALDDDLPEPTDGQTRREIYGVALALQD